MDCLTDRGLHELAVGERATVLYLHPTDRMRRRFLDMGLIEGTVVECVGTAAGGDPSAYRIRGAVIAIRTADARSVRITGVSV